MNKNLSSLISRLAIRTITKKSFHEYFNNLLSFLQDDNSDKISFVSFNNYFSLCSFITGKIYKLFTRLRIPEQKIITADIIIEGLSNIYLSNLQTRAKIVFNLLDFDNDGYINMEDCKLLFSHFHF